MIIANLSNLCWATEQRRRNQAIFCHLLKDTDTFEEGFFLQTPMVKKARTFQFSRMPELELVKRPEECDRPVTVLQPVLTLPDGYPPAATKRVAAELGQRLVKEFFRGRPYVLWINSITHFQAQLAEQLMPGAEFRVFDSSEMLVMYGRNSSEHMTRATAILNGCDVALCSTEQSMAQISHPAKIPFADTKERRGLAPGVSPLELPPLFPKAAGSVYVGFTGMLTAEKLDFDLLHAIFMRFPEYQFIFIGYTNRSSLLLRLKTYPNFHYIPDVSAEVFASILHQLDLAIIPELHDGHTRDSDGARILDYAACGVPVLTTNLPSGQRAGSSIHLASSVWEFSYLLERLVANPPPRGPLASSQTDRGTPQWDLELGPLKDLFANMRAAAPADY
jgi:glycosyltransferase involved in cell wall biosynthesis